MLSKLLIRDFRCFTRLELEFDQESTCIVGNNATGKTSLLEAIAVLTRLQSPRTTSFAELIRIGAKGLVTDGFVSGYHLQFYYSGTRRKLALDGVEQKNSRAYLALAKLVYFANSDIGVVRGPAELRRRLLDFIGCQVFENYRSILRSYEKALRSRNRYLKMVPLRRPEVKAYSKPLVQFGTQLSMLRASLIRQLEPHLALAFAAVSDRNETLGLAYLQGATADFEAALRESEKEESRFMTTVIGPHRDDLQITLNDRPAEIFASEGQQRTIVIALKLAEAKLLELEFKKPPLLLLDDVFGELDAARRKRLFLALPSRGQRFITATRLDWPESLPVGKVYRIVECDRGERALKEASESG
jgi:DNA replication and repair protein RecF